MYMAGLAYLSVAWNYAAVPFLFFVFFLERMFSFVHWLMARGSDEAKKAGDVDPMTRIFFAVYGVGTLEKPAMPAVLSAARSSTNLCTPSPASLVLRRCDEADAIEPC